MPSYRVVWEIDIDADSALEAAQKARAYQLNPDALVGHFACTPDGGEAQEVDLDECAPCGGTGVHTSGETCDACEGTGEVR